MEVHFTPDVEDKLIALAAKTGRPAGDLVQDAVADYVNHVEDEPTEAERRRRAEEAVARIHEIQKHTRPDPEGWTIKDYINYGRR
jgi:predicted DNA-binding protein